MWRLRAAAFAVCALIAGCAVQNGNILVVVQNDRGEPIIVQPDRPAPDSPTAWVVEAGSVAGDVQAGSHVRFFTTNCATVGDITADSVSLGVPTVTFHDDGTFDVSASWDIGGDGRPALIAHEGCSTSN